LLLKLVIHSFGSSWFLLKNDWMIASINRPITRYL
jgi:hypothetical protein